MAVDILSENGICFNELEEEVFKMGCEIAVYVMEKILGRMDARIMLKRDRTKYRNKGTKTTTLKTLTAQAGVHYKDGLGIGVKAKAAVASGRTTTEFSIFGSQIELGVSGDVLSAGAEATIGVFPDEGFKVQASAGVGLFGGGFIFRIKAPDKAVLKIFDETAKLSSTLKATGGKAVPYVFAAVAWVRIGVSIFSDDPVARAAQRGYTLK